MQPNGHHSTRASSVLISDHAVEQTCKSSTIPMQPCLWAKKIFSGQKWLCRRSKLSSSWLLLIGHTGSGTWLPFSRCRTPVFLIPNLFLLQPLTATYWDLHLSFSFPCFWKSCTTSSVLNDLHDPPGMEKGFTRQKSITELDRWLCHRGRGSGKGCRHSSEKGGPDFAANWEAKGR